MAENALPVQQSSSPTDAPRHESKDVNAAWVLASIAMLTATIALVYVAAWWALDAFTATNHMASPFSRSLSADRSAQMPPEPRLEGIDELEMAKPTEGGIPAWHALHELEQQRLDSYGWVDRQSGIIHLPIRSAMRIAVDNQLFPVAADSALDSTDSASNGVSDRAANLTENHKSTMPNRRTNP
jgi:hypothetical protein